MEYLEVHARTPRPPRIIRRKGLRRRLPSQPPPSSPERETAGHELFWRARSAPAETSKAGGTAANPIDLSRDSPEPEPIQPAPSASVRTHPAKSASTSQSTSPPRVPPAHHSSSSPPKSQQLIDWPLDPPEAEAIASLPSVSEPPSPSLAWLSRSTSPPKSPLARNSSLSPSNPQTPTAPHGTSSVLGTPPLHGTPPLGPGSPRLPPASPPPVLPPLQPLPGVLPAYLISCHEIKPFSGLGVGPRKFSPDNQYPLLPVQCRKGDQLTARNGKGLPDDLGCYWSSDFFRPMMEVDSDDEDTVLNAPSVLESPRAGMMGKRRAPLHGRGRSMSVVSDASYLPLDSSQGTLARGASRAPDLDPVAERALGHVPEQPSLNASRFTPPRPSRNSNPFGFTPPQPRQWPLPASQQSKAGPSTPMRSNRSRSAAPTSMDMSAGLSMQPPLGVDCGNGLIRLTRPLRLVPVPEKKKNIQGRANSPVLVRPKTLVLREILNPLQYVKAAAEREAREKAKHEVEQAEKQRRIMDEIAELEAERAAWAREREERLRPTSQREREEMEKELDQFKTTHKRRRPTQEEVDVAAHAYASWRTGLSIGIDYWTAVADFLRDHKSHMAAVEREDGWLV